MKIQCSSCDQRLEIPEELTGKTIECPVCNKSLTAPTKVALPPLLPSAQAKTALPPVLPTAKSKFTKSTLDADVVDVSKTSSPKSYRGYWESHGLLPDVPIIFLRKRGICPYCGIPKVSSWGSFDRKLFFGNCESCGQKYYPIPHKIIYFFEGLAFAALITLCFFWFFGLI